MSIEVQNISRRFGNYTALEQVNLRIEKGELVSLLGPSGSGKTTLLRIIAGLESSDTGRVLLHGQDATEVAVRKRQVGFVFQHYALFRHMNVFDNVAFGLNVRSRRTRPSKSEIRERVFNLLKLVQLEGLEKRYPTQLSGGQRQRVALARALAIEPKVLLLDEPFGALDAKVRKELRRWLRQLHEELHITSVFVTHDQEEALEVADRVVVMNNARIEQVGTPREIYDHPATPFVNEFLGNVNSLSARVEEGRVHVGAIDLLAPLDLQNQQAAIAYVRPHNIQLTRVKNGKPVLEVKVRNIYAAGPTARVELERTDTGEELEAEVPRLEEQHLGLKVGETAFASLREARIFPAGKS
ncbi:sulfate ABC transporter, ATPase subunit [Chthoniobacter flavus Ellin428]|uniref:Sulfate ABC transporter, ATPase subunit n=1 Tax=Chthoniobacter flavus Ellin428 TaxID=497964 RepID=B4CUC1_9BACT|nr:sulfate/molybdate ABC transporter ATP-binding protein [Chthoniobacter flavus]EDY22159.1 sulfate ABC transporter, ATPase subunit [Chthoniobacter flavus Ellin428]TCO94809.1 sulfate transport system ATP-binding protein [Chthoniobacter flavus]